MLFILVDSVCSLEIFLFLSLFLYNNNNNESHMRIIYYRIYHVLQLLYLPPPPKQTRIRFQYLTGCLHVSTIVTSHIHNRKLAVLFCTRKIFTIMTLATLFLTATKLAGVLVSVTVAANAFSFSRFKRKNLTPFQSPIDESADVLADFNINPTSGMLICVFGFSFLCLYKGN